MTNTKTLALALLTTLALSASACTLDSPGADGETQTTQTTESAFQAGRTLAGRAPVVSILIGSDPTVRQGVLIDEGLVLTSGRFIPQGTNPRTISVRWPDTTGPGFVTRATHVNRNEGHIGFAILQLETLVPVRAGFAQRFATTAPTVGQDLNCIGAVDATSARFAVKRVTAVTGEDATIGPLPNNPLSGEVVEDRDAGLACFDSTSSTVVGLVMSAQIPSNATTTARLIQARRLQEWIASMRFLAGIRRALVAQGRTAVTPFLQPSGSTSLCADIAWGEIRTGARINQFTCNFAPNQLFWLQPVGAAGSGQFAIISDHSGKCLDVVGEGTAAGTEIQQSPCTLGKTNQTFTAPTFLTGGGNRLIPNHAPNMCLAASGAAPNTTPSTPIVLKTCASPFTSAVDQRWGFVQH